jgi:hypothetical protein
MMNHHFLLKKNDLINKSRKFNLINMKKAVKNVVLSGI